MAVLGKSANRQRRRGKYLVRRTTMDCRTISSRRLRRWIRKGVLEKCLNHQRRRRGKRLLQRMMMDGLSIRELIILLNHNENRINRRGNSHEQSLAFPLKQHLPNPPLRQPPNPLPEPPLNSPPRSHYLPRPTY